MYKLESHKTWRIFKKVCSLVLVLTFSSYVLPVQGFAAESTNYSLSTFAITSAGEEGTATTYDLNHDTFGESVNGNLESANTKAKSGFLHTIIKEEGEVSPSPPPGTDRLAESANFRQVAYLLSIASVDTASANFNIPLACVGEPVGGVLDGYYDQTFSGYIYTILGNPPVLKQDIPTQSWQINTSKNNAFDLDDYFIDPDADDLTFVAAGNTNITVTIDPTTHQVSFSQNTGFVGSEDIVITAIDTAGNRTSSHPITLDVYNTGVGVNNAPVLNYIADIAAKEGSLIKITAEATDPDGDSLTYSFSVPFNSQGAWQTDYQNAGAYDIKVTASDGSLTDNQEIKVTVLNVNRKPTLNYISDINGPENQIITIEPSASDPDNDNLTFSFSSPFNTQGQWRPTYHDAGTHTVTVTVFDGTLSDSQDVRMNITNENATPEVSISFLNRINAGVDEEFSFIVNADDADGDSLNLIVKKDDTQIYSGGIYEFYVGTAAFPSLGIHTITAIVYDNHGGQAQTTANIEIIEPKSYWNKILPLLGDFNGDGIVDIGTYNRVTGRWAVALSNLEGFGSVTEWLTNFGASTDWQYVNGDFNGDGKTDIAIFNQSNGQWKVGISDGASFSDQGVWSTFSGASSNCIPTTGDFNGDGVSDVGVYNKSNGEVRCAISDKSKFNSTTTWLSGLAHSTKAQPFSGDFNGDGLTDIGVFNDGSWNFTVSSGSKFIAKSEWNTSFGAGKTPVISDFNNDGLTDIGVFTKGSGLWQIYHATGDGFVSGGDWLNNFGQGEYSTVYALDFNGDGLTDAAVFDNSSFTWQRLAAQGQVADLLSKITNSLKGTTEITYKPSVYYDNTGDDDICDLPFAIQTVITVKQGDNLGNFYQTNYAYANGLYASEERETRGFGYVKVTDAEGNISENWFNQDDIFKGLPYKTQVSDSDDNLYLETEKSYDYTTPYTGCTFAYLIEEKSLTYEGQFTPRTIKITYEYDDYGNPTKIKNFGDVDISGDEKESYIEYVYNLDLWILGLPGHTYLQDTEGQILSQSWFYYDNQADYTDSPIKGDLTKGESWLNTPGKSNPVIQKTYDAYGNVFTTTDARGNVTTVTYDTTTNTYPETIINQLGHTIKNTYNYKTGQILTSTDPNAQTTRNVYDVFGRIIQVFGPNEDSSHPSTRYEYDLSTTPAKITIYVCEEYNTDDASKMRTSFSFIDGLGRTIQSKTEADESAKQIVTGVVTFNSRGKVEHKYLPYLTDKIPEYTTPDLTQPKATYEYDCLGRLVKLTNLDSTYQTIEYMPGTVTTIDENGHKIRKTKDDYGQTIKVEEFNHGRTYTTRYEYDVQGNLIKTIDDQNNVTSINYDSLGRKLSMDDPDMGSWNYDYDANGNLISQTDAKEQVIEFEYDQLNRLTQKSSISYYYDDPEKPNCIGRLSKITDSSGQTKFFYDNLGREIKSIKTVNSKLYTVNRSYDALDRLTSLTYPDGEILKYTYTTLGGIKTVVGNETYVSGVTYTASGQMSSLTYGNNTYTDYDYNPLTLRLKHLTTNDGALQDLQYQFDNVGNIATITDNCHSATQSFAYDDLNRLISAIGQTYGTKTYRYDSIGNIIEKDGLTYTYGENGAGPHAVTSLREAAGEEAISITYDANGNMLSKGDSTFAYDIENRLTQLKGRIKQPISTTFDLTLQPGWNLISLPFIPDNNQISAIFSGLSFGSDYDQVSRYNPEEQDFDSYNNTSYNQFETLKYGRGYLVYVTNSNNVILSLSGQLSASSQQLALKSGWNLIGTPSLEELTVSEALNNLQQGIDYDRIVHYNKATQLFENLSVNDSIKPGEAYYLHCLKDTTWNILPAEETTQFTYDGDGGRVKKLTSTNTTTYIGSLYEQDSNGTTRNHIFAGPSRIATTVVAQFIEPKTYYYHQDHLGSSNVITDQNGELVQHLEYLPFGQTQVNIGTDVAGHKFTGKELDDSTGLYFYGARYYDPEIGRFITADSIAQAPYNPQTLNRYSYCNNNPINYIDPSGHWSWKRFWRTVVSAFVGAIVTAVTLGAGAPLAVAMMAGGAVSGATMGGMEGGWKGALKGAAIGGAIGLAGGAGIAKWGMNFAYGAIGVAAITTVATEGWEGLGYMVGGMVGGIGGYQAGTGISSAWQRFTGSGQEGINRHELAKQTEQLKRAQQALKIKADENIRIGSRDLILNADHTLIERENLSIVEMGSGKDGLIKVFQYHPKDYITPASRVNLASTPKNTLAALGSGRVQWSHYTSISSVKLYNLISGYEQIWSNAAYAAGAYNSNYTINTFVYGSGGQITGLTTWRPAFDRD